MSQAIIELREDLLYPDRVSTLISELASKQSSLSIENVEQQINSSFSPLRFLSLPSTGGPLNIATHAYYFERGLSQRETFWRDLAKKERTKDDHAWPCLLGQEKILSCIKSQKSMIFREANLPDVSGIQITHAKKCNSTFVAPDSDDNCILEIRRYNLKLGYDTVPKFLDLYGKGLPSKLNAEGTDPTTTLITLLYSEVGRLNEVIEVWRHGNGVAAMDKSRVAARQAKEWRTAIAKIAELAIEFSATIHKPLPFSPIK